MTEFENAWEGSVRMILSIALLVSGVSSSEYRSFTIERTNRSSCAAERRRASEASQHEQTPSRENRRGRGLAVRLTVLVKCRSHESSLSRPLTDNSWPTGGTIVLMRAAIAPSALELNANVRAEASLWSRTRSRGTCQAMLSTVQSVTRSVMECAPLRKPSRVAVWDCSSARQRLTPSSACASASGGAGTSCAIATMSATDRAKIGRSEPKAVR